MNNGKNGKRKIMQCFFKDRILKKRCSSAVNIKLKIAARVVTKARLCQMAAYVIQSELALQLRLARLPHRWNGAATTYPFEDLTQSFPLPQ